VLLTELPAVLLDELTEVLLDERITVRFAMIIDIFLHKIRCLYRYYPTAIRRSRNAFRDRIQRDTWDKWLVEHLYHAYPRRKHVQVNLKGSADRKTGVPITGESLKT
jgi:hypothetical protein